MHVMRVVLTSNYREGLQKICFLAHTENMYVKEGMDTLQAPHFPSHSSGL